MKGLSIVIPAYNEAPNVASMVREVSDVTQQLAYDCEIIVVNDGSKDSTGKIVSNLMGEISNLRLVEHYPNRGYGGALKAGFAAASFDLITFIPADGQFTFTEIDRLLTFAPAADIVAGYRLARQDNLVRRLNGLAWNTLVRLMFGYLARDVDCGFKLIKREVLDRVPIPSDGAMIDAELLAGAKARGFKVVDVPVTHLPRIAGEATGANISVIVKALRELLDFRMELARELREERLPSGLAPQPQHVEVSGRQRRAH